MRKYKKVIEKKNGDVDVIVDCDHVAEEGY